MANQVAVRALAERAQHRVAVLTHVAVDPSTRGRGVGAALIRAFEEAARQGPALEARLVTLAGERGASGFFQRLGWRHTDDRRNRDGDLIREYSLALAGEDGTPGAGES